MDTVGTFEMAKTLAKHTLFTTIHKHYTVEEWENFANNTERDPKVGWEYQIPTPSAYALV